jgi:anti-sigma factor RsiW
MKWLSNECAHHRQQICLLVSGELPEAERGEVENHLTECADCRKYHDELKSLAAPLTSWERYFSGVKPNEVQQLRWANAIKAESESKPSFSLAKRFVAADVSPLHSKSTKVGADSRRLLRFGGSVRGISWKTFAPLFVMRVVWNELIWPVRRIWAGLAVAWVFIAIVNHNLSDGRPVAMAKDAKPAADMFLAWREQEWVLAQLMGKAEPTVIEPPKQSAPQPRSERRTVSNA